MTKHFITYADERFATSAVRLIEEIKKLNIFDSWKIYSPKDLPEYIKNSWIYNHQRGGGYWIWKPYVILDMLKKIPEEDIVLYLDSGFEVFESREWNVFFSSLENSDALFFQYNNRIYINWQHWYSSIYPNEKSEKFGYPIISHWTKISVLEYFKPFFTTSDWQKNCTIVSGAMFLKRSDNTISLISDWFNLMISRQDLLFDLFDFEKDRQDDCFIEHRHDLSILSILLMLAKGKYPSFITLPENLEERENGQALFAARIWGENKPKLSYKQFIKRHLFRK